MDGNGTNQLVRGALLLTLAGIISKILSAGYRIPLQNLTGDYGFYIYQQVYPILGMVLVMSLYGFPTAISQIMGTLKTERKSASLRSFYLPVFFIMLGINGVFFFFLYFNASNIASWIGDVHLKKAYQLAAFSFLFIPFTSLMRGVFQGNNQMKPTAYSQIGEQFIRVTIIIIAAYLFFIQKIEIYKIGEIAATGSIAGAVTAIFILCIFLIKTKPIAYPPHFQTPWGYYFRIIFTLGVVASLNHMTLLIIQFADVFTLIPGLLKYGLSNMEAMEAKGVFDRGQPLIQLGTVLGSSFAMALIPTISKKRLEENSNELYGYIRGALLFSFYLAAGAVIGLITIFPETNTLLFQNTKGTTTLQILAIAIFLSSISITISSILQGLGYFKRTAGFIVGAFLIKWMANHLFVPLWGINGSAVATILSLFLLCLVVLFEFKRKLPEIKMFRSIHWPAFAASSLGMIGYIMIVKYLFSYDLLSSRAGLLLYVAFIACTGALIYILLLLKCRAFTEKELSLLPFARFFIS